jgi:hypothetical protein
LPPCPTLREIRTTLDDFCNAKYDARAHREPLDPCYRECPRAPPSTRVTVRRLAPRAGRRVREIAPSAPSGSGSIERGRLRRSRVGDLLHESRAPPVALPVLASRSKTPRAARERRDPASSPPREREQFHANRGAFRRQDPATYAGIAPVRPLRMASLFWSAGPSGERTAGTGGPALRGPGSRWHLGRVEEMVRAGQLGEWDDVRPTARRPECP